MSPDKKKLLGDLLLEKKIINLKDAENALAENEGIGLLLGSILVEQKIITDHQLQEALEEQSNTSDLRLGEILVARGVATQNDILRAFSIQLQLQLESKSSGQSPPPGSLLNRLQTARISIRLKLALVITLLIIFIMSCASIFFFRSQKEEVVNQMTRFGTALSANLSHNSSVPLLENDEASLHILLEEVSKVPDIDYVMVVDKKGTVKAHSDISKIDHPYQQLTNIIPISRTDTLEIVKYRDGTHEVLDFTTPISFSQVALGTIHVGVSLESLRKKINQTALFAILLTSVLIIIGVCVSLSISAHFSRPIFNLVRGTTEIKNGNFTYRSERLSNDELGDLSLAFNDMAEGLRKKEVIQDAFGKYVNPEIVEMILKNPDDQWFQGRKIPLTVMFTDIRGFTSFSEKTAPEEVVALLNEHFTMATEIILRHGGHVDKFIGDAVLAVFGALMEYEDHAERAVRAAVALQEAMRKEGTVLGDGSLLSIGIGINTGEVIAGNIGSQKRMEFTVIGDTVNLASRLTGVAGPGEVIISRTVYEKVAQIVTAEKLDPVPVKGKSESVDIYRVDAVTG